MTTAAPAFTAWLDEFFASYYRNRPVNATFIGVHDYDGQLPDYSVSGLDKTLAEMETLRRQLSELPEEPLSEVEKIDRTLADGFLETQIWEYRSSHFQRGNPSLFAGEAIFSVLSLFLRPFAPVEERVAAAIQRMERLPAFLTQAQTTIAQAPIAWTNRAVKECVGALSFFTSGIDILIKEEGIENPAFRQAGDKAVEAFTAFQGFLSNTLCNKTSDAYASGAEALDLMIRRAHFIDKSAEEIERYAEEQMAASHAKLEEGANAFGAATWREALAQLENEHPTAEKYEVSFTEVWNAAKTSALENDLVTWPDYPIQYVLRPTWARAAAPYLYFLLYRAPSAFDTVPVVDYLLAPLDRSQPEEAQEKFLRATNDSVVKLNHVVHHGGIGHHVQNWNAYRAESRIGRIAAVDTACRTAMLSAGTLCEGWACYVTDLMSEVGFLTPLETYSQHYSRARMAARAIVDIRLHTGRMTLEEASAFYQQNAGMSAAASDAEAIKNSMFPGGALMYLMGTDAVRDLRRDVAAREGAGFVLGRFHDTFLSYGSIPVSLIAESMLAG